MDFDCVAKALNQNIFSLRTVPKKKNIYIKLCRCTSHPVCSSIAWKMPLSCSSISILKKSSLHFSSRLCLHQPSQFRIPDCFRHGTAGPCRSGAQNLKLPCAPNEYAGRLIRVSHMQMGLSWWPFTPAEGPYAHTARAASHAHYKCCCMSWRLKNSRFKSPWYFCWNGFTSFCIVLFLISHLYFFKVIYLGF